MKHRSPRTVDAATVEAIVADGARALGQVLTQPQCKALARYAALVSKWNRVANLTGAQDAAEFARKFIVDALALRPHVAGLVVADLGSGAGLPGMVLAIVTPDMRFHLVEPRARRARFLDQARIELGLANVAVHHVRGEDWMPAEAPDVILCQAVGSLEHVLRMTAGLHRGHAMILVPKGQAPDAELAALGTDAAACTLIPLAVPGWSARHLVKIDGARLDRDSV